MSELERKLMHLDHCGLSAEAPTLFIAECVFVYMAHEHSHALLSWLARTFTTAAIVSYEQTNMSDKFGAIMLENMEARACKLLGVDACASLDSQRARFVTAGFAGPCHCISMTQYYREKIDPPERARIEAIEFLDETELLFQLMDHYCVCVATTQPTLADIFI